MPRKKPPPRKSRARYGDGSIVRRPRKGGDGFAVKWREPDPITGKSRQRVSSVFDTEDDAKSWNRARLDGRIAAAPVMELTVFAGAAEKWFRGRSGSKSTIAGYRRVLDGHLLPAFGPRALKAIDADSLNAYCSAKQDGSLEVPPGYRAKCSDTYLRLHMWVVRSIYEHAIYEGWHSDYNPARAPSLRISPTAKTAKTPRALRTDDREAFIKAVPPDWYVFVVVILLGTGLRFGEAAGLLWGDRQQVWDEDPATGKPRKRTVLHIKRTSFPDGTLSDKPKTDHSRRSIGLDFPESDALQRHWRKQNALGLAADDQPMFPSSTGTVLRNNNFTRRILHPACDAAGVKRFGPHVLRHTFAYIQASNKCPPRTLKELMGHASASFTLDRYGMWIKGQDVPMVVSVYSSPETKGGEP